MSYRMLIGWRSAISDPIANPVAGSRLVVPVAISPQKVIRAISNSPPEL